MSKQAKITFPVISKGVRRNAETGVEILNDSDGWYVKTFHADKGDLIVSYGSQADARAAAIKDVEIMRDEIFVAHNAAIAEDAKRRTIATLAERGFVAQGRDHVHPSGVEIIAGEFFGEPVETYEVRRAADSKFGYVVVGHFDNIIDAADEALGQVYSAESALAVDTDPAVAAEVAEANGLDEQATAELTEHARKQFPSVAAMLDADKPAPVPAAKPVMHRYGFRCEPHGIGTKWTHTNTGVQITKFPGEPYAVTEPVKGAHVDVVAGFDEFRTLSDALEFAMTLVVRWTRRIQADAVAAVAEHFERFPMVTDESVVVFDGATRVVRRATTHVLLLDAGTGDPDAVIRVGAETVWPSSDAVAKPDPKRLPTKIVRHGDVVTFAPNASQAPADVPGATAVSPWKIDGTDTINRAPGGRIFVHVWQSFNDPKTGFSTRVAAAWLDELRTEGGAARVTLPGFPTA